MTRALIFGIAGQDGHYLARHLIGAGYEVVGIDYRERPLPDLPPEVDLRQGDLSDLDRLRKLLIEVHPSEIYNLAGVSSLEESYADPHLTLEVNGLGVIRLLVAIARERGESDIRFCQASSSQLYGRPTDRPQDEDSIFQPDNPYGLAKLISHQATTYYRRYGNLFATNAILFNHESPLRKEHFVTRRISRGVARIKLGLQAVLQLDNLGGVRDWGFAGDYVLAMHAILQREEPDDYVIASGQAYAVRDAVAAAFAHIGVQEWENLVEVKRSLSRAEIEAFPLGNSSKARRELGWMPTTTLPELMGMMVDHDLALERGKL